MQTETTQAMPVAVIPANAFGELVHLPNILKSAQERSKRADLAVQPLLAELTRTDFTMLAPSEAKALLEKVAIMRSKLDASVKADKEAREPHTKLFDEIRTLFTTEEKQKELLSNKLKQYADLWAAEVARRNREAKAEQDRIIREKQQEIDRKAREDAAAWQAYAKYRDGKIEDLIIGFNAKTAEELPDVKVKLERYFPILGSLYPNVTSAMNLDYEEKLKAVACDLIDKIPGRIKMLQDMDQAARDKADAEAKQERELQAARDLASQAQQIEAKAEEAKLEHVMETLVTAQPMAVQAKGVVQKKKYSISTVNQVIKIVHWYLQSELVGVDVDSACKMFSKQITAANKSLNAGTGIEGIAVEDDFSTRVAATK